MATLGESLVKVCTELLYVVCKMLFCPRLVPLCGPKAAGLVPVMPRSDWLTAPMTGSHWLTLRLKFIHISRWPGCLHLALSGEDLSLGPSVAWPTAWPQLRSSSFHLTDTQT